jgi:aryl-alcohol dehydrogenase-like predicted oxidoreductase
MEYRQLGRSGLRVSALTLGTMTFGGRGGFKAVGATDVTGARRQLDMCVDAGVNLIDTADVYSGGFAEEITGEVITGRRDALLLSTKVRMTMGPGPNDAGLSRQHIIAGCEASLRRLGTDHIDIYHVHEWDGQTRLEETMSALNSLVTAGKVRYLAASNYAGWQLMKALAVADANGFERFAAQQVYYSLEARDAEYELVPLAVDQGLGLLIWSPLAGGLVSGKYRRNGSPSEGTRQVSGTWHEPPVRDQERLYDTVEVLVDIAAARGASPAQVALAWLLGRPAVTSLIIGARTDAQLRDNLGAADLTLAADEREALDKVSAPELVYPHWHQAATAKDRLGPADLALLGQHLRS